MTVQECYSVFGGDYLGVSARLRKDERILKYLRMFVSDESDRLLADALAGERYEEAFRHVHNLKGVALNLGLTPLQIPAETLCEALRPGKPTVDISAMTEAVFAAYRRIYSAIQLLD